jgi:uncharacterized protein YeaO (DUF488 family)
MHEGRNTVQAPVFSGFSRIQKLILWPEEGAARKIMTIMLKRIYETPEPADGYRILVERLWPRGMSKEHAKVDLWLKEAGASPALRTWFGHDPEKWEEFRRRYFEELRTRPGVVRELRDVMGAHDTVTFLFGAHDTRHNNALALKEYFEETT